MTATPQAVFERFQEAVLAGDLGLLADQCAEDVVVELPYAPPGRQAVFHGYAEFAAFARPARAALPVRFEEFRTHALHQTTDPEVLIAEYELTGTVLPSGKRAAATFVAMLRVRDGRIVHWREYQNIPAMTAALTQISPAQQAESSLPG